MGRDTYLVRLPDELKKDLKQYAERKGRTLNSIVLEALWEYHKQIEHTQNK